MAQQGPQIPGGLGCDPGLGQRSARSSWARVAASTLSFLQPGRGDGFAAAGMDQVRLQLQFLQQLDQPAPAVGGLEGHRGARRQRPKDRDQLAGSLARLRLRC